MTRDTQDMPSLDSLLATLHDMLEDGATRDDVLRFAALHPDSRMEIMRFTAEWFAAEESDLGDENPTGNRTATGHHSILERFWADAAVTEPDPFDAMPAGCIQQIAATCRIDTGILRKLSRRLVDAGTIPGRLIAWLSVELGTSPPALYAYLGGAPVAAGVDFFAPDGRAAAGKVSFATAVTNSTLDLAQKRFWLPDLAA